jgi:hypothetical protein
MISVESFPKGNERNKKKKKNRKERQKERRKGENKKRRSLFRGALADRTFRPTTAQNTHQLSVARPDTQPMLVKLSQ